MQPKSQKQRNHKLIDFNQINSFMFVPAIKEKFYEKISTLEGNNKPDGIIFDLEDSIDTKHKERARDVLLDFFSKPGIKKISLARIKFLSESIPSVQSGSKTTSN